MIKDYKFIDDDENEMIEAFLILIHIHTHSQQNTNLHILMQVKKQL